MIYLRLTDSNKARIVNSFPSDFVAPEQEEEKKLKTRYLRKKTTFGVLEFLMLEEERIANSNKVFYTFTATVEAVMEGSVFHGLEMAKKMADDYLHNIVKIHGNQKSIVERCVSEAEGKENYNEFVTAVKENIQREPGIFAEDLCALSKEVRLIDYHIGGYKLLHDASARVSVTNNHNLKKFLLGLLHLFFDSFKKNNVLVSLHEVDENFFCAFEYETFNIAMHSFIENAVKYAKPYSKIVVHTKAGGRELSFVMESIRIEKDEIRKIYERGAYGSNVPEFLRGNGIGMYLLKQSLDRSNISIDIAPDYSQNSTGADNIQYIKNTFMFTFPKYRPVS